MKQFLSVNDVQDIDGLIDDAIAFKADPRKSRAGKNYRLGLVFMNPSLRTRVSTQVAAQNLGMEVIVLNTKGDSWAFEFDDGVVMNGQTAEHIKEAAAVLGSYFDILGVRTFPTLTDKESDYSEKVINGIKAHAGIPVLSLESATRHPLQSLADAITIREFAGKSMIQKPRVVLMWAPHIKPLPQSVPNSFAEWMNRWDGVDFSIAHPEGYELAPEFAQSAPVFHNQAEALEGADFVYVKNWSSYSDYGKVLPVADDWMLSLNKLKATNNAKVMHCLPVRRNVVLPDEILDSKSSIVIQEAGNRVWSAQAVLSNLLDEL